LSEVPPFYLAVTVLEHGESLLEQEQPNDAARLLIEARETFERLGATPWLERTARALNMDRQAEVAS
jgi:hypothetical protein